MTEPRFAPENLEAARGMSEHGVKKYRGQCYGPLRGNPLPRGGYGVVSMIVNNDANPKQVISMCTMSENPHCAACPIMSKPLS